MFRKFLKTELILYSKLLKTFFFTNIPVRSNENIVVEYCQIFYHNLTRILPWQWNIRNILTIFVKCSMLCKSERNISIVCSLQSSLLFQLRATGNYANPPRNLNFIKNFISVPEMFNCEEAVGVCSHDSSGKCKIWLSCNTRIAKVKTVAGFAKSRRLVVEVTTRSGD